MFSSPEITPTSKFGSSESQSSKEESIENEPWYDAFEESENKRQQRDLEIAAAEKNPGPIVVEHPSREELAETASSDNEKSTQEIAVERFKEAYYNCFNKKESDLVEYEEKLGFKAGELNGKIVLNIGSGPNLKFENQAKNIGARIIALNPAMGFLRIKEVPEDRRLTQIERDKITDQVKEEAKRMRVDANKSEIPAVAGYVQELPFADDSFDLEVSMYGIPGYLPKSKEEYRKAFSEVVRTLRSGGEARFFPIENDIFRLPYFWDAIDELDQQGHRVMVEKFWLEVKNAPQKKLDFFRLVIRKKID